MKQRQRHTGNPLTLSEFLNLAQVHCALEGAFSAIHLCQNLEKKGMKSSETTPLSVVLIVACKKKIHVLFLNSIHPTSLSDTCWLSM